MKDPVLTKFLEGLPEEAARIERESEIAQLTARPGSGDPPSVYDGVLAGIEHFVPGVSDPIDVSASPIPFDLTFPRDYCRSVDGTLQFRVARVRDPIVHPNCARNVVCLGRRFQASTPLRRLLEQLHAILSSRVFASDDPLDRDAASFYLAHLDRVRALRSEPLWRRPVAQQVRVDG